MDSTTRRAAHHSSPIVTREALAILLYHLIVAAGSGYSAYAIDREGKATVSADDGRLDVLRPDSGGRYDLGPVTWVHAAAQAS